MMMISAVGAPPRPLLCGGDKEEDLDDDDDDDDDDERYNPVRGIMYTHIDGSM